MMVTDLPVPKALTDRVSMRHLAFVGIGWLGLFFVVPVLLLLIRSLNFGSGPLLGNYADALSGIYLWTILRSFYYGILTTAISVTLGFGLSYYIAFKSRMKLLLLGLVILPFWVAYIIRYLGIQLFFSPTGPFVGVFGTDFGILFSTVGVIVGLTSALMPFAILPIYNSLNSIDEHYIEASYMLGAGRVRTLRSVIIPLSLSGIVAAGIIVFILATGSFLGPAILGGPQDTMVANLISETFRSAFNLPLAAAIAVIYTTVLIVLLVLFNSVVNIGEVLSDL
jgi:ABC-type spermidine/putrescine transport system permease subunit I